MQASSGAGPAPSCVHTHNQEIVTLREKRHRPCAQKNSYSASWLICVDEGEVDQPAVQPQVQLALLFGTMMMRRCVLRPARATAAAHASGSARRAPLACRCSASTAAPEVTTAPQQKAEGEAGVKVERRWVLLTTSSKHPLHAHAVHFGERQNARQYITRSSS